MSEDGRLLRKLRRLAANPSEQRRVCDLFLESQRPVARKARWAYSHYLARAEGAGWVPQTFTDDYLAAWRDSILHLVNSTSDQFTFRYPADDRRCLFIGWHFPEYPLMLQLALQHQVLVLVASYASWMEQLRQNDCIYEFRTRHFSSRLLRSFIQGRPIFAMLDHCYPETEQLPVEFLGYPSRTPVGVFMLALRYRYRIYITSIQGKTIGPVRSLRRSRELEATASRVNAILEREILKSPSRWLQWPAVDSRWIGVSYND